MSNKFVFGKKIEFWRVSKNGRICVSIEKLSGRVPEKWQICVIIKKLSEGLPEKGRISVSIEK